MRRILIFLIFIVNCIYAVNLYPQTKNMGFLSINIPENLKPNTSILIIDARDGAVKYSLNATVPRLIASNVKLFTTYFALNELKPDFHWQTRLYYTGSISDGVLHGNLYLVGGGDPTLDTKAIYAIFSVIKQYNIKRIDGNLILDSSIFNSTPVYSMLDTNPYDTDSILPSGLMINGEFNNVSLSTNKESAFASSDLYGFKLINELHINQTESVCSGLYNKIKIKKNLDEIMLYGQVPLNCANKQLTYRFLSNFAYNRTIIYKVLGDLNIQLNGDVVNGKLNKFISKPLYTYNSPNLEDVLINMNRFSVNLIAETLLLTVGAYKTSNQNTYIQGKSAFINFLASRNLLDKNTVIENGAGLSRFEYFSVSNVVNLLLQVSHSQYRAEFIATLPVPGLEGTLKHRFTAYQNNIHAKTGTLNDTEALSGYFVTVDDSLLCSTPTFIGNVLVGSSKQCCFSHICHIRDFNMLKYKNYIFSIVFNDVNTSSNSQSSQINDIIASILWHIQVPH